MGKRSIKTIDKDEPLFSRHKSYSAAEILAAGGATAFAKQLGKHPGKIFEQLKKLPDIFLLFILSPQKQNLSHIWIIRNSTI